MQKNPVYFGFVDVADEKVFTKYTFSRRFSFGICKDTKYPKYFRGGYERRVQAFCLAT